MYLNLTRYDFKLIYLQNFNSIFRFDTNPKTIEITLV